MTGSRTGRILLFCTKFAAAVAVCLPAWWYFLPQYVWTIGQAAGAVLRFVVGMPIEAMRVEVDETGVLNTKTALVYIYEQRRYPIDVAQLVANVPPFVALVLATPGLGLKRTLKVMGIGLGILASGHLLFLVLVFKFSRQVQQSPELPTAFGLFLMTLPFILWIVLAYWDKLLGFFEDQGSEEKKTGTLP